MHIRPIHTPADYQSTFKEVWALVDADPPRGTPDADRLDILGYFAIGLPAIAY
jgi:HTH-type transcriptional regulator / antitoxin HigA